jgi:hypothetical protein
MNPDWANIDTTEIDNVAVCTYCQEPFANYDSVMEKIHNNTYYTVRHIPKTITFTCFNLDCEHVDEDSTLTLKAIIQVVE